MLCPHIETCDDCGGLVVCVERPHERPEHTLLCKNCPRIGSQGVRA